MDGEYIEIPPPVASAVNQQEYPPPLDNNNKSNDANDEETKKTKSVRPPEAPKSAFMCFSAWKHDEMKKNGEVISKKDAITHVAEAWRSLSEAERAYWNEEERNDKLRFVKEKAAYKGPWDMPKRRAKKHPLAPKRPMSAFLKYSQNRRKGVKEDNPDMSNTDISRLLGEMWRNASPKDRKPYQEQEEKERAVYKAEIAKWRADQARIERERALSMPAASSDSHPEDTSQQESKPSFTVPYEYSQRFDPLNRHDPNGAQYNQAGGYSGYYYQRSDYHHHHHNHHSSSAAYHRNPRTGEGSESTYPSFHHYYPPPPPSQQSQLTDGHHHHDGTQSSQQADGQGHNGGTSAEAAAEPHAQPNDEARHPYYYPYAPADGHNGGESVHPYLSSGSNRGGESDQASAEQGYGTIQSAYSCDDELQGASTSNDFDVPPPLPPPQMNDEVPFEPPASSAPRGSFYAQL